MLATKNSSATVKTRSSRPAASPSLVDPALLRQATTSPSLSSVAPTSTDDAPSGFFRPVSSSRAGAPEMAPAHRASPSLDVRAILTCESPSLGIGDQNAGAASGSSGALTLVSARGNSTPGPGGVPMTTAVCKRASRMARPAEPSQEAMVTAIAKVNALENALRERGLERLASSASERFKFSGVATGKGPAVKADTGDAETDVAAQAKMNHMVSIKSRHVGSGNQEPTWLLDMQNACPVMFGKLVAAAIRCNAVNASVTQRSKTQGAANQTSRINTRAIGQAAAAQVSAVAVSMAIARHTARKAGVRIGNPMATNAANAATLWQVPLDDPSVATEGLFPVTMTSRLVFNASPAKLGAGCVLAVAKTIAAAELEDCAVSERMGSSNHMLEGLCKAISQPGDYELDAVWASWVLVVYLSCHPEGRSLLRETSLTDVDYQTATAFEAYGRAEITRRARLEAQQQTTSLRKRARSANAANSGPAAVPLPMPEGMLPMADFPETPDLGAAVDFGSVVDRIEEAEREVLGKKRKRGSRGQASASTSDSSGLLQWWYGALRCDNNVVLMSLIAHSKQAARKAATSTLEKQADGTVGVADNLVIRGISEQNAVSSAQALVPFVGRRVSETPAILAWKWNGREYRGLTRTHLDARITTLHSCYFAPAKLQPARDTRMRIAWSVASMQFAPRSDEFETLPGILERLHGATQMAEKGKRGVVVASRVAAMVLGEAEPPRPTALSGVTRSTLSLSTRLTMHVSQLRAGVSLGGKIAALDTGSADAAGPSEPTTPQLLAKSQADAATREEPLCTPSTRLAVGIGFSEELRGWMSGKSRKNDPCKVVLGVSSTQERSRDAPAILNAEPPPLLTLVDFDIEIVAKDDVFREAQAHQCADPTLAPDVQCGLALHVCGDGAVRVPEILSALREELTDTATFVHQARSTVWAAMSQASFIGNVGSVISAGFANSAISSSKKISVADNHRLPLLTPFDVYAAGLTNIEPAHHASPYVGTYGCVFDHGISAPGLLAHNLRSDKRQHGNMCLSEEMADRLSARFAAAHWITCSDGATFCEAPVAARGIPHHLIPGIHACLDGQLDALETLRTYTGRTDSPTVDSLLCLPFGPFTQALAPVIEATADLSMRLCVRDPSLLSVGSGKAYLPDTTPDEEAIVREPLFRRPCQASLSDNPFANSYEHVDSFFNVINGIVLHSRCAALEKPFAEGVTATVGTLARVDAWVTAESGVVDSAVLCADVLLLLNLNYPMNFEVAEDMILPAIAKAPHLVAHSGGRCLGDLGLSAEELAEARAFWQTFVRQGTGVWKHGPLGKLLALLDEHDGSHDVTRERFAQVRGLLENTVQAAWLVGSPDGVSPPPHPHPACEVSAPEKVRRPVIDPVFVSDVRRGIPQRGCLVGVKPHQLRQVCALAMGSKLPDVECQAARNEGGLSLRVSSAADILTEGGLERSSKSISPVQTEADEQAFGSREDKLSGCVLQRKSWDKNAHYLAAAFVAVREPLSKERRSRGELGVAYEEQQAATVRRRDQQGTVAAELDAKRAIEESATGDVAKASRAVFG